MAEPRKQIDVDDIFSYHPPDTDEKVKAYDEIRRKAKEMAHVILAHTPACADQTAAIRKLREAVMTANAAVALGGRV